MSARTEIERTRPPSRDRRRPRRESRQAARSATAADRADGRGLLLVLLAVEGATIPWIHPLLSVHIFLGVLLLGPVALKLASTGYRFVRYYTGATEYVQLGPPAPLMRVLVAPVLVLSTATLFGTGVILLARPPPRARPRTAQSELHRLVRGDGDPRARLYASRRREQRSRS